MTEEEAKTKWCPKTFNCEMPSRCIASECMWWVHEKSAWCHPDGREPTKEELHEHLTPEDAGLITIKFGHCGAIK